MRLSSFLCCVSNKLALSDELDVAKKSPVRFSSSMNHVAIMLTTDMLHTSRLQPSQKSIHNDEHKRSLTALPMMTTQM